MESFYYELYGGGYCGGSAIINVFKENDEIVAIEDSQWLGIGEEDLVETCYYRTNCGGMIVITRGKVEFRPSYSEYKVASITFYEDDRFTFILRKDAKAPKPAFPDVSKHKLIPGGAGMIYRPDLFPTINIPRINSYDDCKLVQELYDEDGEPVNYASIMRLLQS
jgi:hypothetical protein